MSRLYNSYDIVMNSRLLSGQTVGWYRPQVQPAGSMYYGREERDHRFTRKWYEWWMVVPWNIIPSRMAWKCSVWINLNDHLIYTGGNVAWEWHRLVHCTDSSSNIPSKGVIPPENRRSARLDWWLRPYLWQGWLLVDRVARVLSNESTDHGMQMVGSAAAGQGHINTLCIAQQE